jgi:hypothetical protein
VRIAGGDSPPPRTAKEGACLRRGDPAEERLIVSGGVRLGDVAVRAAGNPRSMARPGD